MNELRKFKNAPLLPNLRSIGISQNWIPPVDKTGFVLTVAPPSLEAIDLHLYIDKNGQAPVGFPKLIDCCPAIQRVTFHLHADTAYLLMLLKILGRWRKLRCVDLQCSIYDLRSTTSYSAMGRFLAVLSTLPLLEEFRLEWFTFFAPEAGDDGPSASEVPTPISFQSLLRLRIQMEETSRAQAVLDRMSCPSLQELTIATCDTPSMTDIPQYLAICSFSSILRNLTIESYPLKPQDDAVIRASSLLPLKHLHNLHHVCLRITRGLHAPFIETSDDDWAILAPSWPLLQSLAVIDGLGTSTTSQASRPTYRSLESLAQHCPDLREITMTLVESPPLPSAEGDARAVHNPARLPSLRLRILTVLPDQSKVLRNDMKIPENFQDFTWEDAMALLIVHPQQP